MLMKNCKGVTSWGDFKAHGRNDVRINCAYFEFIIHVRYDVTITGFAILKRNMSDTRLYDLLGVKPNASDAEIKKVRLFR